MNEVLDNFEEKRKKEKNYAQKSLQQFIIAVISLVIAIGILWFVIMPKFGVKIQRPN